MSGRRSAASISRKPLKDRGLGGTRHGFAEYGVALFRDQLLRCGDASKPSGR
jgi:hypothetical protein